MSELQRVFLAVLLCLGIFMGYQYLLLRFAPPQQKRGASVAQTHHGKSDSPTSDTPGGAAPAPKPGSAPVVAADANAMAQNPTPTVPVAVAPEARHFSTELFAGTLSNVDLGLTELGLTDFHEAVDGDGAHQPLSLVAGDTAQARFIWQTPGGAPALRFVESAAEIDKGALRLAGKNQAGLAVQVQVRPREGAYGLDYVVRAVNEGPVPTSVGAELLLALKGRTTEEGHFLMPGMRGAGVQLNALCDVDGDVERIDFSGAEKKPRRFEGGANWVALDRQYFLLGVVPALDQTAAHATCVIKAREDLLENALLFAPETLAPGAAWEKHFTLYAGPKVDDRLNAVSPVLLDSVDYTIWHIPMGFIARPLVVLLKLFHGWTHSWGMAIVLLTVLVKILLLPLSLKGAASMRRMQVLKPDLDRIKNQYANDRERQQLEQMKLFKEKGVNPMGGCWPTLLQMPIGLALYRMLWSAVDLYHQPFLWLPDLTGKEPFPILAIALGAITLLQQRLSPVAMDNQQAKVMMYVMPAMLTFFMIALPSGLVVYILVNSILTIIQQLAINKRSVAV